MVLMLCGVAGVGASFAFASGSSHGQNTNCKHTVLFGTVAAPQSFTVTVTKSWWRSSLTPGQTVNVNVGASGQTLRFMGDGCVGTDGTVTVRQGVLRVMHDWRGGDGQPPTTTGGTTTNHDSPPTTTNGNNPPTTTNHDNPPTTTNDNTTTSTTPK
jgi:hypothetical protein